MRFSLFRFWFSTDGGPHQGRASGWCPFWNLANSLMNPLTSGSAEIGCPTQRSARTPHLGNGDTISPPRYTVI
jgi:hypothetical protein